ncbi:MAG TPA: type II secretion system F family protein [Nevskiales bacterium]|nr:type II secretion system F family protein [Nevskiales bacterium]
MSLPLLVALAVGLGVLALAAGLAAVLSARDRMRLAERLAPEDDVAAPREGGAWWQRLAEGGRGMERWFEDDVGIDLLLVRAGWREARARTAYYLLQIGLPALVFVLLLALALTRGLGLQAALLGTMAVIVALLLPRWLLRRQAAERQRRIRAEVPLFVNLMMLLLEAGLSTRQALHSLVRDGGGVLPELGNEFRLALRQIDAGGDLGDVLASMGQVLDVPELAGVLGVLRQVERYGGEVREPLQAALMVMQERRGLDLRERVNLLAGRMTVVMVLFFFPALMLCVAGPAFSSIFRALRQVMAS